MRQYLKLLEDIRNNGTLVGNRTGINTIDLFGHQIRFNLADGFPAMTTKKLFMKGIIHELLWIISGSTNIKYLVDNGVKIWNEWPFRSYMIRNGRTLPQVGSEEWNQKLAHFVEHIKNDKDFADKYGELGPVYGYQWRKWPTPSGGHIDQLANVIEQIKKTPDSRRMIVSAWNPADIDEMAKAGLPPCHCFFQFSVKDGKLSCQLYQRSADVFLGVPFNIASYALLTMMIAQVTGLQPGEFVHTFGSVHIYTNHLEQIELQLAREPRSLPTMMINPTIKSIDDFRYEDFSLENYDPHPPIKGEVAV